MCNCEWLGIESAPNGKKLILGYRNPLGMWRTIVGRYYLPMTLGQDDDNGDPDESGYAPEGWYEERENEGLIDFTDQPPTHWMPLPKPPKANAPDAQQASEGK